MTISADLQIDASGNITTTNTFVPGTSTRYTTLDLHAWLQDLADDASYTGNDIVSILNAIPSELAGKRNTLRPMALSMLNGFNINQNVANWLRFGSVEQTTPTADLYTGLKILGLATAPANSPVYFIQNNAKITKIWADTDYAAVQILVKAKASGTLIDSGNITAFTRKYGQTYSHFDANLAAGGEQVAALSTAVDSNVNAAAITPTIAAGYFSTVIGGTATPGTQAITIAYGDTTQDLGGGQGSLLHKGTITLNGVISVAQAYQALMWACSESSGITFNTIPGYRYRVLPGQTYTENLAAPFGSFAGGKWFVAQGWWLTGTLSSDSKNYQLISHVGTVETPPTSVSVSIGGLAVNDYVLVARDNAGAINTTEYTVSATAAATTATTTVAIKLDTPASGVIRIAGDRYTYTSFSGSTFSGLSPAIKAGGYSSVSGFVPLIDTIVSSGTTLTSSAFQYVSDFVCRYRVRNGVIGGTPIVGFESTLLVTNNGGAGTTVRNADS